MPTRTRRRPLSTKLRFAWRRIYSTLRTRAVGCLLQTRAAIRARGRSCCRSGCIGPGARGEAVEAAQQAVGTAGNLVTGVTLSADTLTVTFADGTTRDETLPAGMTGDGTDQTARDAAAAAQSTGDGATTAAAAAQSDIDAHEASTHNTDAGARTAAAAAAATAATAQTTASTARDAAVAAQSDADTAQTTAGQAQVTATAASAAANAARADIDSHEANHPTGMGGGPAVLYESTAAIGTSTGLIAGNVACPETGELEFYFEARTGTRQGGVASARIPTARIRGAVVCA